MYTDEEKRMQIDLIKKSFSAESALSDDGTLYRWNDETGEIEMLTVRTIPVETCPPGVLKLLFHQLAKDSQAAMDFSLKSMMDVVDIVDKASDTYARINDAIQSWHGRLDRCKECCAAPRSDS